ncbi:unnamed protein product [Agarophyton chilense]|eukprot:gb/GEZJ01002569.1/.p1 GENE.gb/GEZJ01002569.1/~~gb/GEZJ01002569.1/.p1  ORF type:complete len:972 (+),score=152.50 gb/GEZJ01002569.1/:270-3185(+)
MSRTHKPFREQPSSQDAWQQHNAFYKQFNTPTVRDALAVARAHLQPIFIEHARFAEDCGLPTVTLGFLVDHLQESQIIPPLTSHTFMLGLEICISPDLSSPLRSPSKNYSNQRIHFDTFVEAFAFSLFCYPIEQRSAANSSASLQLVHDQQVQCFAEDIKTALHRFVDNCGVSAGHNSETVQEIQADAAENGSHFNSVSTSLQSELQNQNIQEQDTGHETQERSIDDLPSTPVQQTDGHQSKLTLNIRKIAAQPLQRSSSGLDNSEPMSPERFYTPRCNFPAASPRRLPVNSSSAASGPHQWFTPRHSVAKMSPDVHTAAKMRPGNHFSPNQPNHFQLATIPRTSSLPKTLQDTFHGSVSSCGDNIITISDSHDDIEALPVENYSNNSRDSTIIETDGGVSSDINAVEDISDSEEEASSPESHFQSPEISDAVSCLPQLSPEDSRKLSFDTEDEGNISDDSSRYESDEERSTPAVKLAQAEEFGQEIDEPDESSDFEGEGNVTRLESVVEGTGSDLQPADSQPICDENGDVECKSQHGLEIEEGIASDTDDYAYISKISSSELLPDRIESANNDIAYGFKSPLFANAVSPGRLEHCRSDSDFLGESEHEELLYKSGNISESSELSMHSKEAYIRMLNSYIETGSFGNELGSPNGIAEDGSAASAPCCLTLESSMEEVFQGDEQTEFLAQDAMSNLQSSDQTFFNGFVEVESANSSDQQTTTDDTKDTEAMVDNNHTTDTVSYVLSKTETETLGSEVRSSHSKINGACGEEIIEPHACAPLQDASESTPNQCVLQPDETSIASEMSAKDASDRNTAGPTPEDFEVVRKPVKARVSFDPLSSSPLSSACTSTSEERRKSIIQSRVLSPPVRRKLQNLDEMGISSDIIRRSEPSIIVHCNSHERERHILAALQENTQLCRMWREEVESRRRSESIYVRLWIFFECFIILVIVVCVVPVVWDSWIARDRFTRVLM